MIGNDIIDLQYTKETCDYTRPGFLNKILTKTEQELIKRSDDPFVLIWRMWSMKESAYKIYIQKNQSRLFNPHSFHCSIVDDRRGKVCIHEQKYLTHSTVDTDHIFTFAQQNTSSQVRHKITRSEQSDHHFQSQTCRTSVKEDLAQSYNWDVSQIEIRKAENGKPEVYYEQSKVGIDISLTHHGFYMAHSIAIL